MHISILQPFQLVGFVYLNASQVLTWVYSKKLWLLMWTHNGVFLFHFCFFCLGINSEIHKVLSTETFFRSMQGIQNEILCIPCELFGYNYSLNIFLPPCLDVSCNFKCLSHSLNSELWPFGAEECYCQGWFPCEFRPKYKDSLMFTWIMSLMGLVLALSRIICGMNSAGYFHPKLAIRCRRCKMRPWRSPQGTLHHPEYGWSWQVRAV